MTPTETLTDQTPDMAAIGPRYVDDSYLDQPEMASAKPRPTPGSYILQFGNVTASFKDEFKGANERGDYTIAASIEALPKLTIVSDADGDTTFAGAALNPYYRLSTKPVRFKGENRNFSTLSAAMAIVGLDYPKGADADAIIGAAQMLSGATTLKPVTLTLQGEHKYKKFFVLADGTRFYLDEKVFRQGSDVTGSIAEFKAKGGTWAPVGFIVDGAWTLTRPSENVEHTRVFANLEPTDFGWKPRS